MGIDALVISQPLDLYATLICWYFIIRLDAKSDGNGEMIRAYFIRRRVQEQLPAIRSLRSKDITKEYWSDSYDSIASYAIKFGFSRPRKPTIYIDYFWSLQLKKIVIALLAAYQEGDHRIVRF